MSTSGATQQQKINLLFKKYNNVVDVIDYLPYTDPVNRYPYQSYTIGDNVFSDSIPADVQGVTYTDGFGIQYYGISALHREAAATGESLQQPSSTADPNPFNGTNPNTLTGHPQLDFYFRLELIPAQDTINPPTRDKRTWYFPDKDDDTVSFCKDAIAFNYDSSSGYSTYTPILESKDSAGNYTAYQYYGNTSVFFR